MADLSAIARDPAVFAGSAGVGLSDWQAHDVREAGAPGGIACWVWTRQAGKSRALGLLGLWQAFRRPGSVVLVVSGGGELGARRLLGEARRIAAGSPLLSGSVVDESSATLRLDNDARLVAVAAHEAAIRGWSADALLVDEAQLLSAEVLLGAALPTVAARPHAFTVLAGTAGRGAGPFFDIARRAELGAAGLVFSRRVSEHVGGPDRMPWQSPSVMAALEAALGQVRAAAELRGVWSTGGDFLFTPAELDRVTADFRADALSGLRGPAGVWAGLDFGISRDRSALVALGRPVLGRGEPLRLAVRCSHVWEPGHPVAGAGGVLSDVAGSRAVLEHVMADGTGTQAAIVQALGPLLRGRDPRLGGGRPRGGPVVVNDAELDDDQVEALLRRRSADRARWPSTGLRGVVFGAQSKQAMYGTAKWAVGEGLLLLSASQTELRRDLLAVRVGLNASGGERFEATGSDHDDLADALVLALRPYRRKRDGAWRTVAGDLLQSGATTPEYAPEGLLAAGEVRTGGGLVLPRAPTWASPARARAGMSVPAEVEGWRPPPDPRLAGVAARVRAALDQEQDHDEHTEVM